MESPVARGLQKDLSSVLRAVQPELSEACSLRGSEFLHQEGGPLALEVAAALKGGGSA